MILEELKEWGRQGYIPGPEETEETFVKRVDTPTPDSSLAQFPSLCSTMKAKLGLIPLWVAIHYSKKSLTPWEGGALFTEQTPDGVYRAFIQLRKSSFVDRDEILLHESIHALRVAFNEPRFEEMMAYHFSKKPLRRTLGPLFSTPKQAYIFFGVCLSALWIPLSLPLYILLRGGLLLRDRRIFHRALHQAQAFFPDFPPFQIILRMTDKEIKLFANQSKETISAYLEKQKSNLRWKQVL